VSCNLRRRRQHRKRWSDGITDSVDLSWSKTPEDGVGREEGGGFRMDFLLKI